jgi:hypothetical protein
MRASGAWCAGLLGLLPVPALAQTPAAPSSHAPPSYALSWVRAEGAEECPAAHALAAEVERRLGRPVFDAKAERSIEVDVMRFGDKYRSDVYVRDASGHALGHRQLESDEPGCGALLSATALAVALVIDPEAAAREPSPPPGKASFEPVPPPPPPAPPPPAPPIVLGQTGPVRPALTRNELEVFSQRLVPADIALGVTYNLGLVPGTALGAELSFAARPWQSWGFALSADYVASHSRTRGIGSLDVGLTRGSALLVYYLTAKWADVRCWWGLGPTLGAFHVGVRSPAPVTDSGDFLFAAVEARTDFQMQVSRRIYAHFGAAGVVAPRRQEFLVRNQSDPVWRQPALAGSAFFGLGMTFP